MTTSLASLVAASLPSQQASGPSAADGSSGGAGANSALSKDAIPKNMAHAVDIDAEIPLEEVCLSSLALSKIVKHGREGRDGKEGSHGSSGAMGVLVGLDLEGVLDVADSFALPGRASSSASSEDDPLRGSAQYQNKMLSALKDVKGAHTVVGYYHAVSLGQMYKNSVVDSLVNGSDKIRHGGVVVIHDTSLASRGMAAFKAYKLSPAYLNARKASGGKFNTDSLAQNQLTFSEIFNELPVTVRSSPLATAFLQAHAQSSSSALNPSILSLPSPAHPIRALESLIDTLDSLRAEENNSAYMLRQIAREKSKMEQYIAKRREENSTRVVQGLQPLPEQDYTRMFKIPNEPSRMEGMMLLGQVDGTAKELEGLVGTELVKMYAAKAG